MMVRNACNKALIADVLHPPVVRLAVAIHETTGLLMTEMREDLARIEGKIKEYKTELVNINSKLDSLDTKKMVSICQ